MSLTNEIRHEITDISRELERFKELLLRCPHHGFETWSHIQYFYNGLTQSNNHMIESMNGGEFLSLTDNEVYKVLDKLFENSQQWDFSSHRDKSSRTPKKGGHY